LVIAHETFPRNFSIQKWLIASVSLTHSAHHMQSPKIQRPAEVYAKQQGVREVETANFVAATRDSAMPEYLSSAGFCETAAAISIVNHSLI